MPRKSKDPAPEIQADAAAAPPAKKKRAPRKPRVTAQQPQDAAQQQTAAVAGAPAQSPAPSPPPTTLPHHGIVVGKSQKFEVLDFKFGNRHGLVTGATGTGKTVTLQVLAEGFSRAG